MESLDFSFLSFLEFLNKVSTVAFFIYFHQHTLSLSLSRARSHLEHRASVKRFVSFQFLVGRTPCTRDQPIARPLPIQDNTNRIKADIRDLGGVRSHDPSVRAIEDRNLSFTSNFMAQRWEVGWMLKWSVERSGLDLSRYCSRICLEELRKITKNAIQVSRHCGRDSNPAPLKC
jgi:hypothetical protein